MRLFHISRDINRIDEFKPKCPKYYNKIESEENRICLANSIEGCVSAISWWLGKANKKYIEYDKFTEIRVHEFDSNKILKENLITPDKLREYNNVFDAELTGEHWVINQNIKPQETYLIRLIETKYTDIKEKYTEKERKLNREKGNEDKKEFIVKKFSDFKYEKIDINKYKEELKKFLCVKISSYYNNKDLDALVNMQKYINLQLQYRDYCKNEITDIFEKLLEELKLKTIKLVEIANNYNKEDTIKVLKRIQNNIKSI